MSRSVLDLCINNGSIVSPFGIYKGNVGIRDGVITVLTLEELNASRVIDAEEKFLLPGVIDPHGHFVEYWGFEGSCLKETPSMAAGGVTTYVDYAQTTDSYHSLIEEYQKHIAANSTIDMSLHALIMTKQHVEEIPEYAERWGITSFKCFMAARGVELYPGAIAIDDGLLYEAFWVVAKLGYPARLAVHAENWEIVWNLAEKMRAENRTDPASWSESRPSVCEEECIWRAALYAHKQKCPLYIPHIGTGEGPRIIAEWRAKGLDIVGETCPHYLMIHKDHPRAVTAKYNPAIKTTEDNQALWCGIAQGWISCIGSDHIPSDNARKFDGKEGNIWTASTGVPGSCTILPITLDAVRRGVIPLEKAVEVTSFNPARVFGLYPRKGTIALGSDADIVIVDMEKKVALAPGMLGAEYTLFDGMEFEGWPILSMVRGNVVMEDGEVTGRPGTGRFIPRPLRKEPVREHTEIS